MSQNVGDESVVRQRQTPRGDFFLLFFYEGGVGFKRASILAFTKIHCLALHFDSELLQQRICLRKSHSIMVPPHTFYYKKWQLWGRF